MVESKDPTSHQEAPLRLYRAALADIDIQVTVRIWSTADRGWVWAPLDTWTPDPTPTTPAQLSDELHHHGWVTAEAPTTLTEVDVTPENWQDLVCLLYTSDAADE